MKEVVYAVKIKLTEIVLTFQGQSREAISIA